MFITKGGMAVKKVHDLWTSLNKNENSIFEDIKVAHSQNSLAKAKTKAKTQDCINLIHI